MLSTYRSLSLLRSRSGAVLLALALLAGTLPAVGGRAQTFDIKKVEPSVYKIFATPKGTTGTGFLVSGKRTVVTNFHVVDKNNEFVVIYRIGRDVQVVPARVVGTKPHLDLAVLRTDRDLPGMALTLAEFEPDKLTSIVTVGFPAAADDAVKGRPTTVPELIQRLRDPTSLDATVTTGVVSRMTSAESATLNARTVQHNAAINPGNSGGPLFDQCANVVGVNTLVALHSQGLFFSIHSAEVLRVLREFGIEFAAAKTPCAAAADSARSGLLLPVLIGMSALLALVALVLAVRSGARLGGVGPYVDRLTRMRVPLDRFTRRPSVPPAASANGRGPAGPLSLQSTGGRGTHPLEEGSALVVGRAAESGIVIDDDTVSASHARLEIDAAGERVSVTDLGSSNGTFLNGSRVSSARAKAGDVLRFGEAEFRLAAGARGRAERGWLLSGRDTAGRALQFELRPRMANGSAGEAVTTWRIGRDRARVEFVIDDNSVSGTHAEIAYAPRQGLTLRDLGSTNGTKVDGKALGSRAVPLSDAGQEIVFGAARLRLSRLA
jgi:pSer/pThr/pTyr-binding forkhead associated (FHA) protein